MKRIGMFLAIAAVMLFVLPAVSYAGEERAAVVIKDGSCQIRDGNGVFLTATEYHKVITRGPNNTTVLKCQVKDVPNDTGRAVHFNFTNTGGDKCGISLSPIGGPFVITDDWDETVSASGNATLTCRYKNP